MSQGRTEVDLDRMSRALIRIDHYEYGYQEAMKWRQRLKDGTATLADCNKAMILQHFDALASATTAWRGKFYAGRGKR